ncbi:ATP-binding cassette domain-containing protein [Sinorhizobium sp. BG8]|uniref:ABC transporter ATP-binding protein n=1 Tax=Sinorhizobium sp. BG8 TaxID=2613773 RepID=UPI00193DFB5F|nr:ATP-binding cassette domain-containing protein [Sinorhizobium sp. BG8]QRM57555.1 ABC transporter ATP-binding protein [Sinorhizobium sp. BG8]
MNTHQHAGVSARLKVDIRRRAFELSNGGRIEVVRDLTFELAQSEFVCVVGPSGCGKTTTLRIVLGLDHSFEGTVEFPETHEPRIGAVFQEPLLLPWRTVEQNVRLAQPHSMRGDNLDDLYATLGLSKMRDFYPSELSLGLARRAAIARALAIAPDLLVLDEPFVSLDEATAQQLRNLLLALVEERPMTVLMVTHNLQEAVMLADRIIVLSPRPCHVLGNFLIRVPRQSRNPQIRSDILRSFHQRFPGEG